MKRQGRGQTKKPASPNSLQIEPLTFDPSGPLTVEIRRRPTGGETRLSWLQPALWAVTLAAVFLSALTWFFLIRPQVQPPQKVVGTQLSFFVSYPKYLSIGDEGSIEITIVNEGQKGLSDVKVYLKSISSMPISMAPDSNNIADFGNLGWDERKTERIRFFVNETGMAGSVNVSFRVIAEGGQIDQTLEGGVIRPLPIPYLRYAISTFWGQVSIAALGALGTAIVEWLIKTRTKEA